MMSLKQQQIAIAEWTGVDKDYPNDLNAMHEAEKKLDKSLAAKYQENLIKIVVTLDKLFVVGQKYGLDGYVLHATAAQRSEALCRTLWPERFN